MAAGRPALEGRGAGCADDRPGGCRIGRLGEEVYAAHCAACHGAELEGEPDWRQRKPDGKLPAPPHDPSGHTWHHPDPQLFALTKYGPAALVGGGYESDMPAYEELLSDREIRASIAYIKSRWPEDIRAQQAEITRRALEAE
ncbi:MAG: c-type cytochrome [Rhodovibrionaceae bacterium]